MQKVEGWARETVGAVKFHIDSQAAEINYEHPDLPQIFPDGEGKTIQFYAAPILNSFQQLLARVSRARTGRHMLSQQTGQPQHSQQQAVQQQSGQPPPTQQMLEQQPIQQAQSQPQKINPQGKPGESGGGFFRRNRGGEKHSSEHRKSTSSQEINERAHYYAPTLNPTSVQQEEDHATQPFGIFTEELFTLTQR